MNKSTAKRLRSPIAGFTVLATLITQAYAQQADASKAESTQLDAVVVTGFRASLQTSANEKKKSTGFVEGVFAEDLGKFPDSNLAESLSRVPGIQVQRDYTGEGLFIQIRGLGPSFTRILLNGAPIATATSGFLEGTPNNREVDLDILPTDLFTKLTVAKSPSASLVEGGAAGVVNMRSARPFDNPGKYVSMSAGTRYNDQAKTPGSKGSVVASRTFGKTFGILGGFSWSNNRVHMTGLETTNYDNAFLSATQNTSTNPPRNNTGNNEWIIPATVPVGSGNGLVDGEVIDQAFLLRNNPGLTITQIDNAIVPRLIRSMSQVGKKDHSTGVISVEWRPQDNLHFYLDTLYSEKNYQFERVDTNLAIRGSASVPLKMTVDRDDCANGCVMTSATFANTQTLLEYRPYTEKDHLWNINPGMEWKLSDKWVLNAQLNLSKGHGYNENPTVLPVTGLQNGNTAQYNLNGGDFTLKTSYDVNSPAVWGWSSGDPARRGRVNMDTGSREVQNKGARTDLTWGDTAFNVKAGLARDEFERRLLSFNGTALWQNAVCGNNPSPNLLAPNGQPPCLGLVAPGSAAALYPGYGTGSTAGSTAAPVYTGSLIPNASLQSYLYPGPDGFALLDWARFRKDSNYDAYLPLQIPNPGTGSSYIKEKVTAFSLEASGETSLMGMGLRYNGGVRYVSTEQTVGVLNSRVDSRNATLTSGGLYAPSYYWTYLDSKYKNVLPAASVALDLSKTLIARASLSRSMTRANPIAMAPGIEFSAASADNGSLGSPGLKPYISDNFDMGLEWYTGREGYVSATFFHKKVNGFTVTDNLTLPFSSLAQYGVTYDTLTAQQKLGVDNRGGPNVATVFMQQQRNASGSLKIDGVELGWVQPLDKILPIPGFGITESYSYVKQSASGEGSTGFVALGVPKRSNNFTVYYERNGYMARIAHSYSDGFQLTGKGVQGITEAAIFKDTYKQVDFSSSFDLETILDRGGLPTITFDIGNLTNSAARQYFQFKAATYHKYTPGRTYGLGARMKF